MSTDAKRTKTSNEKEVSGMNLDAELRSAFDVPILGDIAPEEELILGSLPMEAIEEKIREARGRMGGSVKIRQLEDGSYVLSPNPKRRRTDIDEEEGSKGAEISGDPPGGEDKVDTEDPKGKKNVQKEDETVVEVDETVLTPEEKARAAFVQRIRDGISRVLPPEAGYQIADMRDVSYDTRYHGLLGPEELSVQFKNHRYPAIASFMDPAEHFAPYIVTKGDILFFKRHERGLPVLEFLHGTSKKGYWAALCFVPKKCRSTVWQDTPVNKLPLDQLFRIVALSYVDWHLTMQEQTAVDPVQLRNYCDSWEQISRKFGDQLPKQVVRVLTQGLTLSEKNVVKDDSSKDIKPRIQPPRPSFETEEDSFEVIETGSRDEVNPVETNPPKQNNRSSSKPIVEYKQLFSVMSKTEKTISGVMKDQTILKNTLKEHSKVLDAISSSILSFNDPKTSLASVGTAGGGKIKDLEAEVCGLKTSVSSLVGVCKDLQAFNKTLVEKMDAVIQDKSRLSWEEFSQRQRDILSLNQHLAVPMQPPRWPGVPISGSTMGSYMEGLHAGGQISAGGVPMGYGGGPTLPGSVTYPLQGLNPSLGVPTLGLTGAVAPVRGADEKQEPPQAAPTQEPALTATSHPGATNDDLVRLLLQQLQRSDGTQK